MSQLEYRKAPVRFVRFGAAMRKRVKDTQTKRSINAIKPRLGAVHAGISFHKQQLTFNHSAFKIWCNQLMCKRLRCKY